ncbi:transmembrane protein 138 [Diaphorina citri]|uniref:Transmembrane protein 138 n=1 Tax=Diaphorina citri TaxID=121845 RepID=A0A1S3D1K9_DIACI|nr:transmembrane protein 138 [Diaphorina citri]
MRISTEKYIFLLIIQLGFLLTDLLFNAFSDSFRSKNINLLIIYILQIIFQILMFIALLISLFQTNVFQAGFVILIYDRFKATIVICLIYLVLTIGLHAWVLYYRWLEPTAYIWTDNFLLTLFVLHRMSK